MRPAGAGDSPERQARNLLAPSAEGAGPRTAVVVTLGAAGALLVERDEGAIRSVAVPALAVTPLDTTGAGDAFNGALAAGMLEGRSLPDCVRRAAAAAGLATMRSGAREGMPTGAELDAAMAPIGREGDVGGVGGVGGAA